MKSVFEQIVSDQKEERDALARERFVSRPEEELLDLDSPLAQIIIGVRRSGKSTLAHKVLRERAGDYAYLNFDDERLLGLTAEQLNPLLEALYSVYGDFSHLFLDEVQNIEAWHLFVNRLLRKKIRIVISGSNAKLLSGELATHLTGRFRKIELFPFSFREILARKNISAETKTTKNQALIESAFEDYLRSGGFPETQQIRFPKSYLRDLFDAVISRDVLFRHPVRFSKTLREIALAGVNAFAQEFSFHHIAKRFGVKSPQTVKEYAGYLEQAYLLLFLQKFSFKKTETQRSRKCYVVDPGLVSAVGTNFSENSRRLLENVVFIELSRRCSRDGKELFFYKENREIDFVVKNGTRAEELIQVCWDISAEKTLTRELAALAEVAKKLRCGKLTLLTRSRDEERAISHDGKNIVVRGIVSWLLDA